MSDQQGGFLPFSSPDQSPDIAVAQNVPPSVTVPYVPKGKTIKEDDTIAGGTQQWSPQNPPVPAYPVPFSGGEHVDTITGGTEAWKPPILPERQIGKVEAAVEGAKSGVSLGFSPAMEGVANSGTEFLKGLGISETTAKVFPPATRFLFGGAKMFLDWAKGDPGAMDAYNRGREHSVHTQDLANEQQKAAYIGGLLAGSAAIPFGGEARLATMPERIAQGVKQGAVVGGVSGVGEGVSRGEDIPQIAIHAAEGTGMGAGIGAVGGAVLGPRTKSAVPTQGERAALTADELLNAPISKGLSSDKPFIRDTTAAMQSLPIIGSKISSDVSRTQQAAGKYLDEVSAAMKGGAVSRAKAAPIVETALSNKTGVGPPGVLQKNKASQNFAYDRMRAFLPQSGEVPVSSYGMGTPATDFVINELSAKRFRAGLDPFSGLEQFRKLSGASFNGLLRARSEAIEPSLETRTSAGFDGAEYSRIAEALTRDMRAALHHMADVHGGNGNAAVAAWEAANTHFARLAEENQQVLELVKAGGEDAITRLIGAAKEKGGDYQLLAKLKNSMNPADWELVGGHALGDMGRDGDRFSLQKFDKAWGKVSDDAKLLMFSPNHLRNINDIVNLAKQMDKALEKTNRSHTTGAFILFEVLANIAHFAGEMMIGGADTGTVVRSATGGVLATGLPFGVGYMLSKPANAAAIRAYLAARSGAVVQPSPARTAMVNIASRNLANTLEIPLRRVQRLTEDTTPDQPQTAEQPATKQKAGTQ